MNTRPFVLPQKLERNLLCPNSLFSSRSPAFSYLFELKSPGVPAPVCVFQVLLLGGQQQRRAAAAPPVSGGGPARGPHSPPLSRTQSGPAPGHHRHRAQETVNTETRDPVTGSHLQPASGMLVLQQHQVTGLY